jgi:alginate O-acetyltransferase complex protein AlgI
MAFNTLLFVGFLGVVVACYFPRPGLRQWLLAVANAVFYGFAGLPHLALFLAFSLLTYRCSRARGRGWLWFGIIANMLNLAFFKYLAFILRSLTEAWPLPALTAAGSWAAGVALPIGISFYTFQMVAYLVDVLRDEIEPSQSWLEFWIFIAFFAQLIAGPIMRGRELLHQVRSVSQVKWDPQRQELGLMLLLSGLAKKMIIADTLAPIVGRMYTDPTTLSGGQAWLAAWLFGFQIYYDFSAYSDIALGIGRLMGIKLARNFVTPYVSANPREFWRRWHITLSSWIRDYIYIPLGGSRHGFARSLAALLAAMALSGLWHGANWTFALWGVYHGLLVVGHRVWTRFAPTLPKLGWFARLGMFQLVTLGWVLFRVADLETATTLLGRMLSVGSPGWWTGVGWAGAAACGGLYAMHWAEYWALGARSSILRVWRTLPAVVQGACWAFAVILLLAFTRPEASSFIYFRF